MSPFSAPARLRRTLPAAAVVVLLLTSLLIGTSTMSSPAPSERTAGAGGPAPVRAPDDRRPNIILFSTDDQRLDEMVFMPKTNRLIGAAGLTFSEALTPHPLCCPARAELLTGQLAQNNGVRTNFAPQGGYQAFDPSSSIGTDLASAGYNTAFLGKPLNGYHHSDGRDPGWTLFNATSHGYADYYDFVQYDNGEVVRFPGYYTDYLSRTSVDYVHRLSQWDAPFFLWVSHFGPHASRGSQGCSGDSCRHGLPPSSPGYQAVERLTGRHPHQEQADALARELVSSPSFNEKDVSDKQRAVRRKPLLDADTIVSTRLARAGALASIDDGLAMLVEQLERDGELDNTYIVFITDNGFQLGEHRWFGKILPYEENLRTPMLVRGPGIEPGATTDSIATIVDLVPTFLEIAGARTDRLLDGISLLGTWSGDSDEALHPGGVLVQGGPFRPETGARGWYYRGVRTARYTYVRYHDGFVELYDRERDPLQLRSVAGRPAYRALETELARRTHLLKTCAGPSSCNRVFGPLPHPRH